MKIHYGKPQSARLKCLKPVLWYIKIACVRACAWYVRLNRPKCFVTRHRTRAWKKKHTIISFLSVRALHGWVVRGLKRIKLVYLYVWYTHNEFAVISLERCTFHYPCTHILLELTTPPWGKITTEFVMRHQL